MATKKAATKKAVEKEAVDRSYVPDPPAAVGKAIVTGRVKNELGWAEIAEMNDISVGKAIHIYDQMTADKIDGTPAKVAQAIVKGRADGESWGLLSARTNKTEGWVKRVWEERTGEIARGHRVGKGGRYPGDVNPNPDAEAKPAKPAKKAAAKKAPAKKAAAKKAPAKKAPAKKAAAKKAPVKLADMDLEQLQARLDGKRVTMKDGEKIAVVSVTAVTEDAISIVDGEDDTFDISISEIKAATR